MVGFSRFLAAASRKFLLQNGNITVKLPSKEAVRCMSHDNTIKVVPSRWQWTKMKDYLHFYVMLGVIPLSLITFYANVFIGPATLTEIPEGYTPKHYEYYKSPITRFFARYITADPQEEYEKYLHLLFRQDMQQKLNKLSKQIEEAMAARSDHMYKFYQNVYGIYDADNIRKQLKEKQSLY